MSGSYAVAQTQAIASENAAEQHARAIALARAERFDEALPELASLHRANPDNALYLIDYAATLSWAERDREALELAPLIDFEAAPNYVIYAIAKSARNARDYATATALYSRARAVDSGNLDAHIGLALSLAEAGDYSGADAVFAALSAEQRRNQDVLIAQAYIQRLGGHLIAALHAYDRFLEQNPDHQDSLRGKALVLRELLLPTQALELAAAHPGILTRDEIDRLEVDALALQLRLAANTVYPEELDGQLLDQTITAIDEHLDNSTSDEAVLALRYDRIAALAERNMAEAAISSFEALGQPLDEIPAYVLAAGGKAYLQIERPLRALRLLERAVSLPPVDIETTFALIFAYLDLDRYEEAMNAVQQTIAQQPLLLQAPDSPVIRGNEDRIRAEIMAALAEASTDQLIQAQTRLETLLADAPNNADLRHELANVYRSRGWIDGAVFEYDQVLTMDEELVYARVGRAHTQLDAQRFRDVEATIESLTNTDAPDPIVEQLAERWQLHNRSELLIEASQSDSSGTTFGSDQYTVDSYWFTRPLRYNYRAFVHLHSASSEFPEGNGQRRRAGVGSEFRADRWSARGEWSGDRDTHSSSLAGSATWRMSDYWRINGALELDSNQTQLRAHRLGIESDLVGVSAEYTPHESSYYLFGTNTLDYSDGNTHESWFGSLIRRVLTRPRSITSFTADVSISRNDLQDVAYFSPRRDLGMLVGGTHEWRIRRRYDRLLVQRSTLQLGEYRQSGFRSGRLWRIGYAIEYRINNALLIELGAQRSRNFYDGAPEHDTSLVATFNARLGR